MKYKVFASYDGEEMEVGIKATLEEAETFMENLDAEYSYYKEIETDENCW